MPYPFGSPNFYGSPRNGSAAFGATPFLGASRVVLVAINGDLQPPISHQNAPLHRMRVTLVPSNEGTELESSDALPAVFRRPVPPLPRAIPSQETKPIRTRLVHGEILRDQEGRLYEKVDRNIRPVQKLFTGPRGEIVEVIAPGAPDHGESDLEPDDPFGPDSSSNFAKIEKQERPDDSSQRADTKSFAQAQRVDDARTVKQKPAPYRQFFAEPGPKRLVRLGDFKGMLTSQLAHPERLRDTHRLACYLQVYEVNRTERLEKLASLAFGDAGMVHQLELLTEPLARVLGLTALPRSHRSIPPNFRRQPGVILPTERVFRLRLAHDPSADDQPLTVDTENLQAKAALTRVHTPNPSPGVGLKKSIPDRFLKAWEFKLTREEALYDMNVKTTFTRWPALLGESLRRWIGISRDLPKWKVMLRGKTPDDQLWEVRLPKGGISHRGIREWSRKTLETAGYDPQTMLVEWEIFWRRKGV